MAAGVAELLERDVCRPSNKAHAEVPAQGFRVTGCPSGQACCGVRVSRGIAQFTACAVLLPLASELPYRELGDVVLKKK